MATHSMIKKTMTITSLAILVAAISVATTMTMVQADPTGDDVVITVTPATQVGVTLPVAVGAEYTGDLDGNIATPITVDIDDGMVWVVASAGTVEPNAVYDIHIEDIDWTDIALTADGAISSLSCELTVGVLAPVPLPSALFTRDSIWITVDTTAFPDIPFEVHCTFEAVHGDVEKTLLEPCASFGVEIKRSVTQECTFKVTYAGARATIIDTLPAEWEEEPVVFTDNDGDDDGKCTVDEDAQMDKGKNKKGNNKSATGFTCVDVGTTADFDVTVTTRESPGKGHEKRGDTVFKPTSCDPLPINSGAIAILLDSNGDVVLGTLDGKPIVLDTSDPVFVDVVTNTSDDGPICP